VTVRDHRTPPPAVDVRDHREVRGGAGVTIRGGAGAAPPAVDVRDHREVRGGAGVTIRGGAGAAPPAVDVRDHRAGVRVRGGAPGVEVRDHRAGADAKVKAGVKTRIREPKPPQAKPKERESKARGEVKVKGGLKIGN
jgi:hypothetical protein